MNLINLTIFVVITFVMTDKALAGNYPIQLDIDHPNSTVAAYHEHDFHDSNSQTNDTRVLKRNRRWYLLWTGISKIVLGFLMPVETRDNVNWRTLNMAHNFQAQFMILPSIIWPWKVFSRSLREQRRLFDEHGAFEPDETRAFVYNALEIYMKSKQMNGRECLLKAICETAHNPIQQRTIFDEVVHTVLT